MRATYVRDRLKFYRTVRKRPLIFVFNPTFRRVDMSYCVYNVYSAFGCSYRQPLRSRGVVFFFFKLFTLKISPPSPVSLKMNQ